MTQLRNCCLGTNVQLCVNPGMGSAVGCRGAYLWCCKGLGALTVKTNVRELTMCRRRCCCSHRCCAPPTTQRSQLISHQQLLRGQKYAVLHSRLSRAVLYTERPTKNFGLNVNQCPEHPLILDSQEKNLLQTSFWSETSSSIRLHRLTHLNTNYLHNEVNSM